MRFSLALWILVDSLAVYRLTRLVTADTITEPMRNWIGGQRGGEVKRQKAFDFITCPWCTSIWLAAGAVAATRLVPDPWSYLALLLTASAVAGALSTVVG